ncbi:MAG: ATP-binding protein [Clostridiales bacterium]|nr:ATP-binding protein [Clostridiales bacterium]
MKQKINLRLIGMSVVVVIVTMICTTFVFYGLFRKQVRNDLKINAEILQAANIFGSYESGPGEKGALASLAEGFDDAETLRVTWIAADGTVLYDNDADTSEMVNHSDRPEFISAVETGEGEAVRRSDTMDKNTFYYAVLMDDGTVLRLASDVSSILSVLLSTLPLMLVIVAAIIIISALIAHMLTKKLLAPIETLAENIEDTAHMPVYKEMVPFVNTIRSQHEDILSAARVRQDFTANVTHELKTPLTAISGYAELIENHMVEPEQETHFAEQIRKNADRLVSLINDIIRLSELDSGSEERFVYEQLDLYETVESCEPLLKVSAVKKNVHITFEGESCPMRGNRSMIAELVENLCQNAIRYNHDGGNVNVTVKMEDDRPVLTVADTGIGIPRDMQERVFERFFRVDKSRSKETGGTGLGLAIVKHIVELHDAEITLESDVGEGTTIRVRF